MLFGRDFLPAISYILHTKITRKKISLPASKNKFLYNIFKSIAFCTLIQV